MLKLSLLGFIVMASLTVHAQNHSCSLLKGWAFRSVNTAGFLAGESGVFRQFQTVNGFTKHQYFLGAGLGLDYYFERTVPIVVSVRKSFFGTKSAPFAYADGSYHIPWKQDDPENSMFELDQGGGIGYELGAGYGFSIGKKTAIVVSAGYSYKPYSKTVNTMPWSSVWPLPKNAIQQIDYQLRRISVKAGISL